MPILPPPELAHLNLAPHPEGGWFKETYRAASNAPTNRGPRSASTAILYALTEADFSAVHRIKSDECWFHHAGQSLFIRQWNTDGSVTDQHLGPITDPSCQPQAMVPADTWFAARLLQPTGFGLVSCTVAPGFDFADFELADPADLTSWPRETWASFVRPPA